MASSSSLVYALIIVLIIIVQALLGACSPPVGGTGDSNRSSTFTDPSTGPDLPPPPAVQGSGAIPKRRSTDPGTQPRPPAVGGTGDTDPSTDPGTQPPPPAVGGSGDTDPGSQPPPQAAGGSGAIPKRRNNAGPQPIQGVQPGPSHVAENNADAERERRKRQRDERFEQRRREIEEETRKRKEEEKKNDERELLRWQREQRHRAEERKRLREEWERAIHRQEVEVRQIDDDVAAHRRQEQVEIPEEHQQYGASAGELGVFTRGGEELDPGSEGDNTWDRDLHDQSQHLPQQDPRLNVRLRPGVCLQWPYIPNVPDQELDHILHDRRQWNIQPQTQDQRPWNIQEIGDRPWNIQETANQPASARTAGRRRRNADTWYSERRGWNVQPHSGRPDDNDAVSVRSTSGVQSWQNGSRPWNVQAGIDQSDIVVVHPDEAGLCNVWAILCPLLLSLIGSFVYCRQHGQGSHHDGVCFHCRSSGIVWGFWIGILADVILYMICLLFRFLFLN